MDLPFTRRPAHLPIPEGILVCVSLTARRWLPGPDSAWWAHQAPPPRLFDHPFGQARPDAAPPQPGSDQVVIQSAHRRVAALRPGTQGQALLSPDRMRPGGKKHHGPDHRALMLGDEMCKPLRTMPGGRPPDLLPDLLSRGLRLAVRLDPTSSPGRAGRTQTYIGSMPPGRLRSGNRINASPPPPPPLPAS